MTDPSELAHARELFENFTLKFPFFGEAAGRLLAGYEAMVKPPAEFSLQPLLTDIEARLAKVLGAKDAQLAIVEVDPENFTGNVLTPASDSRTVLNYNEGIAAKAGVKGELRTAVFAD